MFTKLVGFFKQATAPLSNTKSQVASQNTNQTNNLDLLNKENNPNKLNYENNKKEANGTLNAQAANKVNPQSDLFPGYLQNFDKAAADFNKKIVDFNLNNQKQNLHTRNGIDNQLNSAQLQSLKANTSPLYLNNSSNNFFVTTNEESLNLNDNTGENYLKSIISSDSLIDEMVKPKIENKENNQDNNDACSDSNMFNHDSIDKALRENVNYCNNYNGMQIGNIQVINNKSKNNFNVKLNQNLNQNTNIPMVNVEEAKKQIVNLDSKKHFKTLINLANKNQSKNLNNGTNLNQIYNNIKAPFQAEINAKNNFYSKNQPKNNSKNQLVITTLNTKNLYNQPIESKNNSKNNNAPNAYTINNQFDKVQTNQQININNPALNININKINLNQALITKNVSKPNNVNLKDNYMIIEEAKKIEKTKETPLIARNYRNPEFNFYTNYISENKWTIDDFEIGKKLGSGRFGKVYLVREKKHQFICAIKMIYKSQIITNNLQPQIRRELEIHSHLEHENILKFYGFFWDDRRIYLILEYAPGGEIYRELKNSPWGRFSEEKAGNYIYQMTKALIYLHSKHVIHRDIKPENMLNSCGTIKLSDFGWSSHTITAERRTFCGTLDYLCPEMVNNLPHDYTLDLWCLGILCYEFVTGSPPFESGNRKETFRKIKDVSINFPGYLSLGVQDLIMSLLNKVPHNRLSLEEVLQHPWILRNKDYIFK